MLLSTFLSGKLAATAAGLVTIGGGATVAAYHGALPGPLQSVAHATVGAPAADDATDDASGATHAGGPRPSASSTDGASGNSNAKGPDAAGPAAYGLCNAFTHGGLASNSVAYRALAVAATAASTGTPSTSTPVTATATQRITAYCATVAHPGKASAAPGAHPSGRPTTHPTGPGAEHPSGPPSGHERGRPVPAPSGSPSGS